MTEMNLEKYKDEGNALASTISALSEQIRGSYNKILGLNEEISINKLSLRALETKLDQELKDAYKNDKVANAHLSNEAGRAIEIQKIPDVAELREKIRGDELKVKELGIDAEFVQRSWELAKLSYERYIKWGV